MESTREVAYLGHGDVSLVCILFLSFFSFFLLVVLRRRCRDADAETLNNAIQGKNSEDFEAFCKKRKIYRVCDYSFSETYSSY
jgi:hypothetical protein